MKKILPAFVFALMAVCTYGQKKTYEIGFLLDNRDPGTAPLLQKLKEEIVAVVGEDAVIRYSPENELVNDYSIEKAKEQYAYLAEHADIIIAAGAFSNIVVSRQESFPRPTMNIGSIKSEISGYMADKVSSGVDNLTYMTSTDSYAEDLTEFEQLVEFKNVGIVVETPLTSVVDYDAIFAPILSGMDATYTLVPYNNVSDVIAALGGVDALYLASAFNLDAPDVKALAEELVRRKIPSFSALRKSDVENGIMASNASNDNFAQFFRRIALSVEDYINGRNFSDLPVLLDFDKSLTVNYNTASAIGIALKYSLLGKTNFVGSIHEIPSATRVYDLPGLIYQVLDKNLDLQSGQKDIEVSEQDVKSARSSYLPSLSASAYGNYIDPDLAEITFGQNPEFSTNGALSLQQTLFSEGANASISIQKSLAKAQRERFNSEQLDMIYNASLSYFNALILKSNVDIQTRNLELTKTNLRIASENFSAGQSGKTDLLRFESQRAQNTQSMIEAVNQMHQGFLAINQLANNPGGTKIDVKDATLDDELFKKYNYDKFVSFLDNPAMRETFVQFLVEEALRNSPEIKQLQYNIDATDRSIQLYGPGRFLPTLALQGNYTKEFSRSGAGAAPLPVFEDGYYNVALNLALPIFNRNQNNINKQTAMIQKEQLDLNRENVSLAVSTNIRNGVLNLINQISNTELSKVSEQAARESLDLTQTAYSSGAVNIVQLIDAQNNYLNSQLASTNAGYNYLLAMLQLERYIGAYFLLNTEEDNRQFNERFLQYMKSNE
jgi:outer membrane protein TolC